jgi:uracil-DNA glycosylase family 4
MTVVEEGAGPQKRHPLAACESCPLNHPSNAYVPSKIPDNAKIIVVGEAPGFQEGIAGEPFIGPSGRLIKQVLKHHGHNPSDIGYTNVCLCRPPSNATPPKEAVACCSPRLNRELGEREGLDAIIATGGPASQSVLRTQRGVTALRVGPPKTAPHFGDVKVVATWHPAYCLRNADAFPDLVADIGKLKYNPKTWIPPKWSAYDDTEDAITVLEQLLEYKSPDNQIVVDVEWGRDKDDFDHPNFYGDSLLCVGIGYDKSRVVVIGEAPLKDVRVKTKLKELLLARKLCGHNFKADMEALYNTTGPLSCASDTMLAHYALDERGGRHSLDYLGIEINGAPNWKGEISRYLGSEKNYANVPRPILYQYNAYDVANTWDLWDVFSPQLDELTPWPFDHLGIPRRTLRDVHDHMVAAANQLMYLELNGIGIDRKYSDGLATAFLDRLAKIETELDEIVAEGSNEWLGGINPRSPKQIKEFLLTQGINASSTDVDHIELYQKRVDPDSEVGRFFRVLLVHRRQQKLYGTYVKGIRNRLYRGRVYTTYMLHGTTSGRLASRNPNLQNIVRDNEIRGQFSVSSPENIFIHCDFKQVEGRTIAFLAQDEYLRSIFADEERDLFDELGTGLYKSIEAARIKNNRVRTKAYFYGLSYGREAFSIAMEYGIPVREAEYGLQEFKNLIPKTVEWQEEVKRQVHEGHELVTPFGRQRRFFLITRENRKDVENEALSYLPQSTASDICLTALTELRPALRGKGFIRLTIHDALVVEARKDRAEEVAAIVQETMERKGREFTDWVPFPVDVTMGTNWGEL